MVWRGLGNAINLLTILVGFLMVFGASRNFSRVMHLLEDGYRTRGWVIDMITESDDEGTTYRPVFEFIDEAGQHHTFQSSSSSNPPAYDIGDWVKIAHPKGNPGRARYITFFQTFARPIFQGVVGFGFLLYGLGFLPYLWFKYIRSRAK